MFDETPDPADRTHSPAERAKEKSDEFRMHAEMAAVFEGTRKFDSQIIPGLDPEIARNLQRSMARLEKSKTSGIPVLPDESTKDAADVLNLFETNELSINDYHVHRRPGEVMMARWIQGDFVDAFYERLQAHFDAALAGFKEDERQATEWKQDPATQAYLEAIHAIDVKMADTYLRDPIREHKLFVLSTQTADELNIAYLADYIMQVPTTEIVGSASAPPDEPSEQDLAWFYKLFALRGMRDEVEQMCFFVFLQKSDDSF